jgi:hypothetical protein
MRTVTSYLVPLVPLLGLALACAESTESTAPAASAAPELAISGTTTAVLLAAGDIASCESSGDEATARLLDGLTGTVLTLGDIAYDNGTAVEFHDCYHPTWGRHLWRTRSVPGNHDYDTPGAEPYYAYFGVLAGPPGKGYYSFDLGGWHIVALNSNISMSSSSAQVAWLKADLAAHPAKCTLAFWHHPRFSSGRHGNATNTQPLWQALYNARADVVLNGHDHEYERFARQTPTGVRDDARGIRQFVSGLGGKSRRAFESVQPNSSYRYNGADGVLRMELTATGYRWAFVTVSGSRRDVGSNYCN